MLLVVAVLLGIAAANAQGTATIVVADSTATNNYVPVYGLYADNYLRCQTIYPADMLSGIVGSDIMGVTYYHSATSGHDYTSTFEVKIGICSASAFESEAFDDATVLTSVYTGTLSRESDGTMNITFATPFTYSGGNLIVEVDCIEHTTDYTSTSFYGVTATNGSVQGYSSGSVAAVSASYRNFIPKTGFVVSVSCAAPIFGTIIPTETSATIAWTESNTANAATSWSLKVNNGDWTTINDNPYNLTGLTSNTAYTISLRSICTPGDTSFSTTTSFRTTCGTQSLPYIVGFEPFADGAGNMAECWTSIEGTNYVYSSSSYASSGTKSLYISDSGVVVTPVIAVGGNDVYINFDLKRGSTASGKMAVGFAVSPEMAASAIYVDTINPADNTYHNYEYAIPNTIHLPSGCIVFKQIESTSAAAYYNLDSLTVMEYNGCMRPASGTIANVTPSTADISWLAGDGATAYEVAYDTLDAVAATTAIVPANTNSLTLTGLETETEYNVWVRTVCGTENTVWRYIGNFTTQPACVPVSDATVTATTTSAIALSWEIDSEVGYPSTAVLVSYKAADATDWTEVSTTNNFVMLTGLEEGTTYNVKIQNVCGTDSATVVTKTASTKVCGEVADGSTTLSYVPAYTYYKYSYTQSIYTDAEVGDISTISGISFKYSTSLSRTVDVYIADVANASFDDGWIDISNFTQVASNYTWDLSADWSEIVFETPFVHQPGNDIVIAIDDNTGDDNGTSSYNFKAHTGKSYYIYNDYTNYDPATITASGSQVLKSPDIRFTTICNTDCQAPLAVISDVDAHSVSVAWTPMSSETSWTVGYKATGETEWTTADNNVTAHEYTVSGLNAGTYYQIRIGANCGSDTSYAMLATYTECDVIDVPYTEAFGGTVLNPCWKYSVGASLSSGRLYGGASSAGYAILPQFSSDINTLRMNFDAQYSGYSGTGKLQIGVVSNQNGVETFELVDSVSVTTTASHFEVLFSNYSGTGNYIAIKFASAYIYMDNVEVSEIPSCVHPTALTATDTTVNSLTLTWTENGTATQWVMKVNDGAWQTVTNPYTLNDLTANTAYTVTVASLCTGDTSEAITGTFRTACGVENLPYMEGFENYTVESFPDCWTSVSGSNMVVQDGNSGVAAGKTLRFAGPGVVTTPIINVAGNNLYISFDLVQESSYSSGTMAVGYAASPAAAVESAVYLDTITPEDEDVLYNYEYTFENTMNIQTGCIVFRQITTSTNYWYWLDNLNVAVLSDCQRPDSGSVTVNSPVAATATWGAVEGATAYEVAYGTSGDVNQALETLPATGTTLTLSALTPNTTYYAWVRTVCGAEPSMWRDLGSFTTQPACAQIQNARVVNAEVTELTIGWQIDANVGYASTAARILYKKSTGQQWADANDTIVIGTQLTLTGLEAGTTYNFRIYNICSTDTASYVALNGTTDVACAKVVDAQVLATAMSAVAIGWAIDSEVGYASTAVEVRYRTGNEEWNDTIVTGTNLVLTGLTSGTTYNFSIRNICSADTSQAVTLSASTSTCGEVGGGNASTSYIPTYPLYNYSYTQAIYRDAEVGSIDTISGIWFNTSGTTSVTRNVTIYIADIPNASFANGYIDIAQFTQVITDYSWNITSGWNHLVFDQPFVHQIGNDIVITVDDNTGSWQSGNQYVAHSGDGLYKYNDATNYDPANPPDGSPSMVVPDIRFDAECNVTCPAPILVFDAVESHSATLNWTVLGEETSWTVEYKKATDTVWTVFNDNMTTTTCTIENLEAATDYKFRVGAICGEETSYASASTTTECAPYEVTLTQDYAQGFDSGSGIPICWNTENDNWYRSSTGGHSGGNVYTSSNDMLISPQLDCSTLALGAQVHFWYKLPEGYYGGNSTLKVHYRTAENGDWTAIESATFATPVENWTEVELMLPNSENASYYQIAFESQAGTGYYTPYLYLDEVIVEAAPTCPRVNEFTLDAVTSSTATISWTSTATLFEVKYRTGNGAWATVTPAPTTSTVEITGLEPSSMYELSVRAICAADDTSRVATYSFNTECGAIAATSLPYFEGFENGIDCWTQEVITGDAEWEVGADYYTAIEGSSWIAIEDYSGNEVRLISPTFDVADVDTLVVKFAHAQRAYEDYDEIDQDALTVEYRLSPTSEWITLATYTEEVYDFEQVELVIPQTSSTLQLAFHAVLEYGYGVAIDSLSITGIIAEVPTCDVPTNVTTSNLTANTVTVTWNGTAAQYEVKIIGGGQTITETVNTNSFTTQALTQETPYTVEVRALCANGLNSDWTAALSFTTPQPECGTPTNVQTTSTATSVIITWTGYASEYDVKVTGSEIAPINRTVSTNSCTIDGLVPASTYQVIVRAKCDGQYTDWTEAVTFYTADGEGIESAEGDFLVSMYPNPAKEQVSIRIDGVSGKVSVALIDMSGRTVMSDTMESSEIQFNVSALAKGTYFVRLNGEGISTVRKLVVQ